MARPVRGTCLPWVQGSVFYTYNSARLRETRLRPSEDGAAPSVQLTSALHSLPHFIRKRAAQGRRPRVPPVRLQELVGSREGRTPAPEELTQKMASSPLASSTRGGRETSGRECRGTEPSRDGSTGREGSARPLTRLPGKAGSCEA